MSCLLVSTFRFTKGRATQIKWQRCFRSVPLISLMPLPIWLLAAVLDSEVIASLGALLGFYLGVVWVRMLLRQPTLMLGFLKIGAISLLLIMSLSWLMAQFFNLSTLGQSLSAALVRDVGTSLPAYAGAVAYTLVFAAILGGVGDLEIIRSMEASAVVKLEAARRVRPRNLLFLIAIICCLDIGLIIAGIISYRTFAIAGLEEGRVPWYLPLLQIMFAAQVCLNALSISQMSRAPGLNKISMTLVAASVFLVLFINFTQGRTGFILSALLHLYWVIFFIEKIPSFKKLAFISLIFIPTLYVGSLVNNFMRSSAIDQINLDLNAVGFVQYFSSALQLYQSDKSLRAIEKRSSAENLASRPLVAHPLAKSMALPDGKKNFLLGINLINSAVWALPSAIYPDKKRYPIQEDLLYKHFPVGSTDTADSPYLYAYADFGYVGVFIYPALLAFIWWLILVLIRFNNISSLGALVFASAWISMFTLSLGESSMTGYFALLRNTVLAMPFVILLSKLFKFPRGTRSSARPR